MVDPEGFTAYPPQGEPGIKISHPQSLLVDGNFPPWYNSFCKPGWWNRKTRYLEGVVGFTRAGSNPAPGTIKDSSVCISSPPW